jgi:hypothetical protein
MAAFVAGRAIEKGIVERLFLDESTSHLLDYICT